MSDQLTLRDKFACEALNGMLSHATIDGVDEEVMLCTANVAYAFADAMVAAREEPTAQAERLLERIRQLEADKQVQKEHIRHLEALRPHWAMGYSSDSVAAQTATDALSNLWFLLGAKHQTEALEKLKGLINGN